MRALLDRRRSTSRASSVRGQSLVEFALVLPVLVMMLVGTLDLGRVVFANDTVATAAREAARFAIVHGATATSGCPVGPPGSETQIPAPSASCPYPSPSKDAIREVAQRWAMSSDASVTVEVCYGEDCSGDDDVAGASNERGTPVTVTVRRTVNLAAGGMIGLSDIGVSSASTMRVNS